MGVPYGGYFVRPDHDKGPPPVWPELTAEQHNHEPGLVWICECGLHRYRWFVTERGSFGWEDVSIDSGRKEGDA